MSNEIRNALAHKRARKAALLRALAGTPDAPPEPASEPERPGTVPFDGGARQDQPKPAVTEAQFLAAVFADARNRSGGRRW